MPKSSSNQVTRQISLRVGRAILHRLAQGLPVGRTGGEGQMI
jgi:hypothetical protein